MLENLMLNDVEKFREGAKFFRESAELFDRMGDLVENKTLTEKEKEVEVENIMGRLLMSYIKAQNLFS